MYPSQHADLVVYGGTPGGIASAVRAAREGLTVVLVNVTSHLGGMLSGGLGLYDASYSGNRSPLVSEIFERILAHYADKFGPDSENYRLCRTHQTFEPHVAEQVLTALVAAEPRITVLKGWWVAGVEKANRTLTAIIVKRFDGPEAGRLGGAAFIDASYEGDLLAAAGAPYRVGREARTEFGEPHAGKIFSRYEEGKEGPQFPYEAAHGFINLKPFDLCTGRIFPGSTGEGDRAIQTYNFRVSLTRDPANQAPIPRPANYRRENYVGLLLSPDQSLGTPYPVKSKWLLDDIRDFKFRNHRTIPNRKISWNHGSFPGRNHAYPEADWPQRRQIRAEHKEHELGLLWFLQNDPEVPAEVRSRARELRLSKDEFTDNDHFPWEFYVREARRLSGRAVFTEHDASLAPGLRRSPPHSDSIGITDWMMDSHECTTERQPGSAYDGAVLLSELSRPAHVPFRCLLPPNLDNLIVPVCLSATHIGWGCLRVEPTWIQLAESAAWACVLAHLQGICPADVPVPALQRLLVSRGVMIAFFNDFDMSATDAWAGPVQYFGARGFFPTYDARPHDPLDPLTAQFWIEAAGADARGTLRPLELAQKLAVSVRPSNPGISTVEFHRRLAHELSGPPVAEPPDDPSPLTRGHACIILHQAFETPRQSAVGTNQPLATP